MAVVTGRIQAIIELKNRMSKQLKAAAADAENFQSKMDKMGQMATRVGGTMTAAFTAPFVAIAHQSITTFATFEREMSSVKAVTQASGAEFEAMSDLAMHMGETTVFTASQSAEAMKSFGLAGFETNEILSALGPTLNLAAAGSMDMGTAADIAAKVTRGYGIEAEGTTHAMDVLTKAFTTANTDLSELGNAFKMVGPVAKTAGVSFEMTTASLQVMADAGIIGGMAGRQLRRAMLRLVNPPGEAAKALKKLGVETSTADGRMRPFDEIVSDLEPHLQDTAAMAEIFGTVAMPGMVAILEKGSDSLRDMTAALEDSDGTGQRIADVMVDNVAGAFTLFKSAVEGVWLAIGTELMPVLRILLAAFQSTAKFVSQVIVPGFAKLSPTIQIVGLAFSALLAAAGPLLITFGLIAPAIPAITTALVALGGALSLPVVAITGLIGVVGAYLLQNEKFIAFTKSLGKFLLGLGKVIVKLGGVLLNVGVKIVQWVVDEFFELLNVIPGVGRAFEGVTKFLGWAGDAMLSLGEETDKAADTIGVGDKEVQTMEASLADLAGTLTDDVTPATEEAEESWRKIATTWREGSIPEALDMVRALQDIGGASRLTEAEQDALNSTLQTAIDKYNALGEAVPQEIMQAWLDTLEVPDLTGGGSNLIFGDLGTAIEAPKLSDLDGWFEVGGQIYQDLHSGFMVDANQINMVGAALEPPPGFPQEMYSTGKIIGDDLKTGFRDTVGAIPQTVVDAFTGGGGLSGALQGIGSMFGASFGGSLGAGLDNLMSGKEGTGGMLGGLTKMFGGMMGPLGQAIGALAGPLIGKVVKMFKGQTTQERISEAVQKQWGKAISEGLSKTIAKTADEVGSDLGGMLMHLADVFEEAGGVMAFGLDDAIGKTRDLFVMVQTGVLSVEQAGKSFDKSFGMIAGAVVESGKAASAEFLELLALQQEFGLESGAVLDHMRTQSERVFTGMHAMILPLATETGNLTTRFGENEAAIKANGEEVAELVAKRDALTVGTEEWEAADRAVNNALQRGNVLQQDSIGLVAEQIRLGEKNKGVLESFGAIAVGAFGNAVGAGLGFVEAARLAEPAISGINTAFEDLGITSDNVAFQHLARWNDLILQNETLVNGVDAFDDVLLGLSVTGGLTQDALVDMGVLATDQFERLIAAGFTENEALLMMAPNIFALEDAYREMGIPIDENTQELIDMAIANGQVRPEDQVDGWDLVANAIGQLSLDLQSLFTDIGLAPDADIGVGYTDPGHKPNIPGNVNVDVSYRGRRTGMHPTAGDGGGEGWESFNRGGVGDFGSGTLAMLHGHEAIIPLEDGAVPVDLRGMDGSDDDDEVVAELRAVREELELLPMHLRDAIITSQ